MSLDLPRILPQVEAMSRATAERAEALRARIPQLVRALDATAAMPGEELKRRIDLAGSRWPGAIPTNEPVNATYPAPSHPARLAVLAADGSQVYPDRHGLALYYLTNIGSIAIPHGTGAAPQTATEPHLAYEEAELYGDDDGLIAAALVDGQRDVAELAALARLAQAHAPRAPTLALLDNGLLLWLALEVEKADRLQVDQLLNEYLAHLSCLKDTRAAVAGFVDRPRHANVLALLHLAGLEPSQVNEANVQRSPYRGLTDRALFAARLARGERSARFTHASPVNARFQQAGHSIQFFYLHCGAEDAIARVEIPQWVGDDPDLLGRVHAGIVEQCRSTGGFPYALARAHELAVVTQVDRQALEQMLSDALLRRGLMPAPSRKALTKQWTGSRRRHRL
ncbi:MAG: DNA double-strand break repair nuclease NurA [Chloroflexota bacterium]